MKIIKGLFAKTVKLTERLKFKKDHLESLKVLRDNISSGISLDGVKHSGNNNKKEEIICKIIDLEHEIMDDVLSLIEIKLRVTRIIKSIKDSELALLLELRYLHQKTWSEIADIMHYSEYWVRSKMHDRAMSEAANINQKGGKYS